MVWRLAVFFLCSYRQFWLCWRLFRSPGAGRWWSVPGVVWGCWLLDQERGGVAEKGTVLHRMGVEYCPTSSPPLHGLWGGGGKQAGWLSAILARNNLNPMPDFQRFQVFIELVLIENCGILKIGKRYDHDHGTGVYSMPCKKKKGGRKGC